MTNEQFEKLAEEFLKDTGELAPGKDSREPRAPGQEAEIERIWKIWLKGRMRGVESGLEQRTV